MDKQAKIRRNIRTAFPQRNHLAAASERRLAAQHAVNHHANTVEIGLHVQKAVSRLKARITARHARKTAAAQPDFSIIFQKNAFQRQATMRHPRLFEFYQLRYDGFRDFQATFFIHNAFIPQDVRQ